MRELKKQVNSALTNVNNCWVNAIKEAVKEKKGIDVTDITGKVIKIIADLDEKFSDFEERHSKSGKKAFWS